MADQPRCYQKSGWPVKAGRAEYVSLLHYALNVTRIFGAVPGSSTDFVLLSDTAKLGSCACQLTDQSSGTLVNGAHTWTHFTVQRPVQRAPAVRRPEVLDQVARRR